MLSRSIERTRASAYRIPTDRPESDDTLERDTAATLIAPWAEACGGRGIRVDDPAQVEPSVAAALAFPGPALVDVAVNPDEPPMPASVTYAQTKGFASAFLHGQPRRASIASTLFRDGLRQFRVGS